MINVLTNRDVLRSNFGNSLAMYQIARIGEGFGRVIELTAEGATWPVLLIGIMGFVWLIWRRQTSFLLLGVVAMIIFLQFVLIGAGKPGEYGRFGIFTNTTLAIATAHVTVSFLSRTRLFLLAATITIVGCCALSGWRYLGNFRTDALPNHSRMEFADHMENWSRALAPDQQLNVSVPKEPAPYCMPPLNFSRTGVWLAPSPSVARQPSSANRFYWLEPMDLPGRPVFTHGDDRWASSRSCRVGDWEAAYGRLGLMYTPISWANKPFRAITLPPSDHASIEAAPVNHR